MPNIVTLPNASEQALNKQGSFTQSWFMFFQDTWRAIRRNIGVKLGGTINVDTTANSNSGAIETDLITYDLAAETLKNDGDYLEITAWGTFASNSNSKTVKLYFGSQVIGTITTTGSGSWQLTSTIIRKGASSQEIFTSSSLRTAGTQDLGSALTIKCTGQGSATNDVMQYALIVKLFPYS